MITIRIPGSYESERRYIVSLLFCEFLVDTDKGDTTEWGTQMGRYKLALTPNSGRSKSKTSE